MAGMDIKGKYVGEELEEMAFKVHKQIMARLFAPEEGIHEYGQEEEEEDEESTDSVHEPKMIWIVKRFVEEYRAIAR